MKNNIIFWHKDLQLPKGRSKHFIEGENTFIKSLRDNELIYPAPFSNKSYISDSVGPEIKFEKPVSLSTNGKTLNSFQGDVPIRQIIGGDTLNLELYKPGMTYREILFDALHGAGLDYRFTDFFLSDKSKDSPPPHNPVGGDPKSTSRRELKFAKFGDYYVSRNGHQRCILAMYAIFQNSGPDGKIKNVQISEWL
jgi:hypothetical protein